MERTCAVFVCGLVVAVMSGCEPTVPVPVAEGGVCRDVGSSVTSEGDCNTCTCAEDYTWSCTHNLCACVPGASKPADDGCNVCSCTTDGRWVCTMRACHVDPCAEGRQAYESYRERLVSITQSSGCETDADCTRISENNRCFASCGIALPSSGATAVAQRLESNGNEFCASCPPVAIPPCLPMAAQCVEGVCTSGPLEPH